MTGDREHDVVSWRQEAGAGLDTSFLHHFLLWKVDLKLYFLS